MKIFNLLLLLLPSWAFANTPGFYSTPIFYGKYSPEVVTCTYDKTSHYGFCGDDNSPIEGTVGVTNPNIPDTGIGIKVTLFTELVCVGGICKSNYGEPLGKVGLKETSYWSIPTGYYLSDQSGQYVAYKRGTGPEATIYKMYPVTIKEEYNDSPKGIISLGVEQQTIYCISKTECSYLGIAITGENINRFIPKVLTHTCDNLYCYNTNMTVAGLNPKTK